MVSHVFTVKANVSILVESVEKSLDFELESRANKSGVKHGLISCSPANNYMNMIKLKGTFSSVLELQLVGLDPSLTCYRQLPISEAVPLWRVTHFISP